mmetsp:Transcript_18153/g.41829  ORF Transcript_18153/g.41829 Transcript_18153/m.41829 type:complete len:312 (-) Transcript_18153:106-1041(-)
MRGRPRWSASIRIGRFTSRAPGCSSPTGWSSFPTGSGCWSTRPSPGRSRRSIAIPRRARCRIDASGATSGPPSTGAASTPRGATGRPSPRSAPTRRPGASRGSAPTVTAAVRSWKPWGLIGTGCDRARSPAFSEPGRTERTSSMSSTPKPPTRSSSTPGTGLRTAASRASSSTSARRDDRTTLATTPGTASYLFKGLDPWASKQARRCSFCACAQKCALTAGSYVWYVLHAVLKNNIQREEEEEHYDHHHRNTVRFCDDEVHRTLIDSVPVTQHFLRKYCDVLTSNECDLARKHLRVFEQNRDSSRDFQCQ